MPCIAETQLPATSQEIQYMGRVARSENSVQLAYPGIQLTLRFTGQSVTLNGEVLGEDSYFNAYIDGVRLPRVDLSSGEFHYTFKHYLDPAQPHLLRLVRRDETWHGIVKLDSVTVADDGQLMEPPALPERRMICVGDSITCGALADLIPPETLDHSVWNAERSYGWHLAKQFDAQLNLVSYGGRGLIRDWQGSHEPSTGPQFFERTLPDDPSSQWDHSGYQPDLVTICLGTNDFNQGIPERNEFVGAYVRFVERIHQVHPQAKVLLISGPWFGDGDPKKAALNGYIDEVVAHFEDAGEPFVNRHFFSVTYPGTELDSHPVAMQHKAMAADIARTIHTWLGW